MSGPLAAATFAAFARLLREGSGLAIRQDKAYLLRHRLAPMLRRLGLPDLDALARLLGRPGQAEVAREVIEAMTTNESQFFRDATPFAHLGARALPDLHAARPPAAPFRLWSAGASSGQEAYSLAMVAADGPWASRRQARIVATDIARAPLARARAGRFSDFEIARGLSPELRARHFKRDGNGWLIDQALRDAVSFQEHNLLRSPASLGRFDIVFCRNVLIYFDTDTRRAALDGIADQLAPDGLLYLGIGETLLGVTDRFHEVSGQRGIYRTGSEARLAEPAARGDRPQARDASAAHPDIPVEPVDRRVTMPGHQPQFVA